MADQKMTVAQLNELVQKLMESQQAQLAKIDELTEQITAAKTARSKSGGAYQRKIRDGLEYAEHGISLTWIQALILDALNDSVNPLVIKVLAGRCNALAKADPTNGIGRIKFGDSGLEAQFRAVLTGMQVKGLINAVRGDKLAYAIADYGITVFECVKRDINTGGLKDMFLYPDRVTQYAWDYLNDKFGKTEENNS